VSELGIGIVGTGGAARDIHAPACAAGGGARLGAVCSADLGRARTLAEPQGATAYDRVDALLDDPAVGAVILATPPDRHRELAERAVAAGRHVLIEKPIAPSAADVAALRDLALSAPVVVEVVRNERFMDMHVAAREVLRAGELGTLLSLHAHTAIVAEEVWGDAPAWQLRPQVSGGGALLDLGVHKADLVGWLADAPIVAAAPAARVVGAGDAVERLGALLLTLDGGVVATIAASWKGPSDESLLLATGTDGTLVARWSTGELHVRGRSGEARTVHAAPWTPADRSNEAMLADFVAACASGRRPAPDWDAGTRWILEAQQGVTS